MAVSNLFSVTVQSASSVLAQTAASLSAGSSVNLSSSNGMPTNTYSNLDDIQWQTVTAYHYAAGNEIHYMGKGASGENSNRFNHYIFDYSAQTWYRPMSQPLYGGGGGTGHLWQATLDTSNGNYLFQRPTQNGINTFNRAAWESAGKPNHTQDSGRPSYWTENLSVPMYSGFQEYNGMCVHPNCFGVGDKGLVVMCPNPGWMWGYCYGNSTWYKLNTEVYYQPGWAQQNGGAAVYCPSADVVCAGGGTGGPNGGGVWKVPAGSSRADRTTATIGATCPITVSGGTGAGYGKILRHPSNKEKLLLLRTDGGVVYESTNYGATWTGPAAYSHPFSNMGTSYAWTAGWFFDSVIIAFASKNGFEARMWKPPTS